jgi:hypothetical protein
MLLIRESFLNQTKGYHFGESEWYEPYNDTRGSLYRTLQKEYGRCESKMYTDSPSGTKEIGWVFSKRMLYEDARRPYNDSDYYIREVWVEVREVIDSESEIVMQDLLVEV